MPKAGKLDFPNFFLVKNAKNMAQCIHPFTLKKYNIQVPCGKCPTCRARRASGWSFRLMQEDRIAEIAIFITLTYDNEHIRTTPRNFKTIRKRCLQLYFKRVRKYTNKGTRVKYYACGEYGSKTNRPHYHAIVFNADYDALEQAWICNSNEYGCGNNGCGKPIGQIHFGTVTGASVGYTLKYMQKTGKIPMHKNDDRTPEFALMSKGIGESYLTNNMKRWHLLQLKERMYVNLEDGKKASMPRYYKQKIYTSLERSMIGEHMQKISDEKFKKLEENPNLYTERAKAHAHLYELAKYNELKASKI